MPAPDQTTERYLSLAQAAAVVQLSPRTLRRAIAAQCLQAHHLGRVIRIDESELHRWMSANGAAPAHLAPASAYAH